MKYPIFVAEVNEAIAPNTAKPQVNAGTNELERYPWVNAALTVDFWLSMWIIQQVFE